MAAADAAAADGHTDAEASGKDGQTDAAGTTRTENANVVDGIERWQRSALHACQEEGCDHWFQHPKDLTKHCEIHHKMKNAPITCCSCGAKFITTEAYEDHLTHGKACPALPGKSNQKKRARLKKERKAAKHEAYKRKA